MSYRTKQKEQIIDKIKSINHEFSTKELYELLDKEIGLTTIYRLIDKLVKEGRLTKSIGDDNTTYYHYLEECNHHNHFYLKCEKCGNMIHVDCDCINDLKAHIVKHHNFKMSNEHTIINGICNECSKEGI